MYGDIAGDCGVGDHAPYAGDIPEASDAADGEKAGPPGVIPLPIISAKY